MSFLSNIAAFLIIILAVGCPQSSKAPQKYTNQDVKFLGYGTEQLETILNELFPNSGVLRMDADSANSMNKQNKILTKFQNKFFEFRSSIERDIGAEELKQDIFNELKMEELEEGSDEQPK